MKTIFLGLSMLFVYFVSAQSPAPVAGNKPVKAAFKVYGNCPQCKKRIEDVLDTKGVKSADWNVKTKVLEVVYVPDKISITQVHKLVASAGHDTELEKASDVVYLKLPDCCMYRDNQHTHFD